MHGERIVACLRRRQVNVIFAGAVRHQSSAHRSYCPHAEVTVTVSNREYPDALGVRQHDRRSSAESFCASGGGAFDGQRRADHR